MAFVNQIRLVVLAVFVAGCSGGKLDPEKLPEQLPVVPTLPLPKTADGNFNLIDIGMGSIDLDPTVKDPLTALGGCTDLITKAYDPAAKSLDAAVSESKACETLTPWTALAACCPSPCKTAYATARANGADDFAAFDAVFFQDPSCFPGVKELVGGAP